MIILGKITANTFSMSEGAKEYIGLKGIRIKSKDYNLLIMEDYLPLIGKVEGDVTFIGEDETTTLDNIVGFYRHSHNNFELLIKEDN